MDNNWDEIKNIKMGKTDVLMEAFKYAVDHGVDTVELELTLNTNDIIKATITFDIGNKQGGEI